jgi:hypothetical protein
MKLIKSKVTDVDNNVTTSEVKILGTAKLYAISMNSGTKAPYTLHFEQEIETKVNARGIIFKGSGYAIKSNNRKTALQAFTGERLVELELQDLMRQAEEAQGEMVVLDNKIEASVLFEGYEINISINETTTPANASSEPKRAGKDGPELMIGDQNIYVDRYLVAGNPTFNFLQHDEIVKPAPTPEKTF